MGSVERHAEMNTWKQIHKEDWKRCPEKEGENSVGCKTMKPVGVDNIFKRFSCEQEEQDVRGLYAKLI